ncbi:hypothetical protein SprV_0100429000 [Sparganum proliferum]
MPATAPTPHSSLLTGSDSGCGVGMGRESEVDDSAHLPHYIQSDVLEAITSSLKCLQVIPTKWEDFSRGRPTWRRTVKTGALIYEANRITSTKVKLEARKSHLRPPRNANAQHLPTCPWCLRTFRVRTGLVGHLRINCATRTTPTVLPPPKSSSSSTPPTYSNRSPEPPPPSSSSSCSSSSSFSSSSPSPSSSSSCPFSSAAPTSAAVAPAPHINKAHNPNTSSNFNATTVATRREDQDYPCPHCDRTFTSHIGLVGHWRNYRTETSEPVPGAPTYTCLTCLHCPHRPLTFMHRMNLFGHRRIHENLRALAARLGAASAVLASNLCCCSTKTWLYLCGPGGVLKRQGAGSTVPSICGLPHLRSS